MGQAARWAMHREARARQGCGARGGGREKKMRLRVGGCRRGAHLEHDEEAAQGHHAALGPPVLLLQGPPRPPQGSRRGAKPLELPPKDLAWQGRGLCGVQRCRGGVFFRGSDAVEEGASMRLHGAARVPRPVGARPRRGSRGRRRRTRPRPRRRCGPVHARCFGRGDGSAPRQRLVADAAAAAGAVASRGGGGSPKALV